MYRVLLRRRHNRQTRPDNLLQAQRDYFGAHTYRRTDGDGVTACHTDWIREKKD
ncbi:MAG: hypothetical protein IJQ39_01780 [Thermoguttaceae bacterium]|nr:hypothetical protein [Thermoguttaceae bacterium]